MGEALRAKIELVLKKGHSGVYNDVGQMKNKGHTGVTEANLVDAVEELFRITAGLEEAALQQALSTPESS